MNQIQLGQEIKHNVDGIDLVTGIKSRVKTQFGRPDWRNELGRVGACMMNLIDWHKLGRVT